MRKKHKRKRTNTISVLCAVTLVLVFIVIMGISDAITVSPKETPIGTASIAQKANLPITANSPALPRETTTNEAISDAPSETPSPEPEVVERYVAITMTEDELRDLAAIVYLEARNQSMEGQQAVAEVVLNRVIAENFPDTVHDVLYQGVGKPVQQFSTIGMVGKTEPTQAQYDAISAALYGPTILPADVVFFSRGGENSRVWGSIGDHVFCRQYVWE